MTKKITKKEATPEGATTQNQVNNNKKKKKSQEDIILSHLQRCTRKGITMKEAGEKYDIWRLQARIYDLRKKGYAISTEMVPNKHGGMHAVYRLESK